MQNGKANIYHYAAAAVGMYSILLAHTYMLYPFLAGITICYQALLRWLVVLAPLLITWQVLKVKGWKRYVALVLWIFFIPYPYYNFFQLRHIAEIVKIPAAAFFTDAAMIGELWKIVPVCIYSTVQLFCFCYCIDAISVQTTGLKRVSIAAGIITYASFATVLGLSSRLDTFHAVTQPAAVLDAIKLMLANNGLLNAVAVSIAGYMMYGVWALMRSTHPRTTTY